MPNKYTTKSEHGMIFCHQLLMCIGLCCSFFLAAYLWSGYTSQAANVKSGIERISTPSPNVRIKKIQEVEVGERVIGTNPEITDAERVAFLPDPEPAMWRKLTLEMIKPDGNRLDITLLRPLSWLAELQADTGVTIFLDLPEMGAQGLAKILNIEPCPPIKPSKGNVITGTFHHEATNTIDLHVEGLSKPIGTTDNHPFWSVTRQEFIDAGKLIPGEELHLYSGETAKVVQILPRPGPEQVHNVEVMNEHVYRITNEGVLVHNACSSLIHNNKALIKHAKDAGKSHQESLDHLTNELIKGNLNPGIGSKHLFGEIHEARSSDGARVYFRNSGSNVEIVAKSTKANQNVVIKILKDMYE